MFGEVFLLPESLTHPDVPITGKDSRLQHGRPFRTWCPVCQENHLPMKAWHPLVSIRLHRSHYDSFSWEGAYHTYSWGIYFTADLTSSSCLFPILKAPKPDVTRTSDVLNVLLPSLWGPGKDIPYSSLWSISPLPTCIHASTTTTDARCELECPLVFLSQSLFFCMLAHPEMFKLKLIWRISCPCHTVREFTF